MEKTTVESKIREVIKERGITQSFIAKQADMKESDLSLCMNGKRKLKVSEFINICHLLELDLQNFKEVVA